MGRAKDCGSGFASWCHFEQKSLVKAAAFEASKIGGEIAYNIRGDGKAIIYAVSKLFL
ncbi:hypothetical protein [Campylobacter concisus]|uniref:hypothetical protein n=1 Tax=Campylobacter concisus TaxID=199 RepID=UPI0015E16B7D|nr:hypothetical protein [Campylobacter concisus]